MRRRERLQSAFSLLNQAVSVCMDADAGIRVLAPLVVAQQALRTELGSEALTPGANPMDTHSTCAHNQIETIPGSAADLQWMRMLADALDRLASRLPWRALSSQISVGDWRWLPGAATAMVALLALQVASTSFPLRHQAPSGSAGLIDGIEARPAPIVSTGDSAATKITPPPAAAPRAMRAQRPPSSAPSRRAAPTPVAAPRTRPTPSGRHMTHARITPEATFAITPAKPASDVEQGEAIVVSAPHRPVWSYVPSERRLASFYPRRALLRGREGEAWLQCRVAEDGELDCVRAEETSRSFGRAAMRLARRLRHAPVNARGENATGTPVNLHVVFRVEDERDHQPARLGT